MDLLQDLVMDLMHGLIAPVAQIAVDGRHRIFWLYLIAATLIGFLIYRRDLARGEPETARGFTAYLLPREIWRHQSAATDIAVMMLTSVTVSVLLAPVMLEKASVAAWLTGGAQIDVAPAAAPWLVILFTLVIFVVDDLARFAGHFLMHRVPALWQLHRVHHAAEVLTPFTAFRFHPLEIAVVGSVVALLLGVTTAGFHLLSGQTLATATLWQVNIGVVLFNLLGGTLRHSHIWFSFGPRLERHFISPAMHQIHHSAEPRHFDKNLGYHLAVWDRLAGTAYIPQGRERFDLGLGDDGHKIRGVAASFLQPLAGAARALIPTALRRPDRPTPP